MVGHVNEYDLGVLSLYPERAYDSHGQPNNWKSHTKPKVRSFSEHVCHDRLVGRPQS